MESRKLGGKTQTVGVYKEVRKEVESGYTGDQIESVECFSEALNHWSTVVLHTNNNSVLGNDEFWDMVMLQYKLIPKDLLEYCDRHRKKHSLQHAL
eukprot:8414272-Ditylum_brightwellii.AAC.1